MKKIDYDVEQKLKLGRELLGLKLDYRKNLTLDNNSFGLELEFCDAKYRTVRDELEEHFLDRWSVRTDPTVCTVRKGYEFIIRGGEVVSPIFYGNEVDWTELKEVCDIVKFCLGDVNENTAGHIHIGSQIFKNKEELDNFIFLWGAFENIIKKFFYGDFIEGDFFNSLASDCKEEFYFVGYNYNNLVDLRKLRNRSNKTYAVSFNKFESFDFKEDNTIEFRAICGSLEEEIWQNNLNFLVHFLKWCKNISEEEKNYIKTNYIDTYEFLETKLNFDKALFLVDNIFDNDIDKLYFLKQYFKDFYFCDESINKINLVKKKSI